MEAARLQKNLFHFTLQLIAAGFNFKRQTFNNGLWPFSYMAMGGGGVGVLNWFIPSPTPLSLNLEE
jgi:hypothetical protein